MQSLLKMRSRIILLASMSLSLAMLKTNAQNYTPYISDQGLFSASPDSRGFAGNGNGSVSMFSGAAQYALPVYELKCGSLSLPITLGYSYNGFRPADEASWVGLGWTLMAGGMINRNIQGSLDSSKTAGYNYGQYSIHDSLFQGNNSNFMNSGVYATSSATTYDVAPDIYSCNFNGYSAQFYWYNGRQYMLSYNKEIKVSWPSSTGSITVTTGDGTSYIFGQTETAGVHIPGHSFTVSYTDAWYLTSMISADKKDTISLNYSVYNWTQPTSRYNEYFVQGTADVLLFDDSVSSITHVPVLQSIRCRNTRVNFVPDTAARADILGTMPRLHEIDVIDSINGSTIKKVVLGYGYFNQTSTSQHSLERLKLKQFSIVNPSLSSDSQSYHFSYTAELNTDFPPKYDMNVDSWGFWNGDLNGFNGLFYNDDFYRYPNLTYNSYAALDTVLYPTGGYTFFEYELNDYDSSAIQHHAAGPGIRVKAISQFLPSSGIPATRKTYSYLADNGTASSGKLTFSTIVPGPVYIKDTFNFNKYVLHNNTPGSGILDDIFYYSKVSELSSAGNEKHKTDYYYRSFSNAFGDLELSKKVDYRYDSSLTTFAPMVMLINDYDTTADSSFLSINPYVDSSYISNGSSVTYKFAYAYNYNPTYWKRLTDQKTVSYDALNDSTTTITYFNYNSARNMDSSRQTLPDGRAVIQKFKYPDDYATGITGNMVAANIINPIVEKQTWLQNASSPPKMISGSITSFDQTIFKPLAVYSLEPASPLSTLNNETLSGGKYAHLISDTINYILKEQFYYDGNNNLKQNTKTNNINTSYIWDYRHSIPVAVVNNAAATQIAYTSFEADNGGNWTLSDTAKYRSNSLSGKQSYSLTTGKTISASAVTGSKYIVSYWATNGAVTVTSNGSSVSAGPAGPTKNGWTYYEHVLPNTTSAVSLTAASALIDELRLYPADAQMITYTFIPLIGKSSICDVDNRLTYYTYDGLGRLSYIRDQDGNIVKTMEYHFKGQ